MAKDERRLNVNLALASQLARQITEHGLAVEVIYAEVSQVPSDFSGYSHGEILRKELSTLLEQWNDVHSTFRARPSRMEFLGFDIAWPVPSFHSVIRQPGFDALRESLMPHINKSGLVGELDGAAELADAANRVGYGGLSFCVIGVWAPEQ